MKGHLKIDLEMRQFSGIQNQANVYDNQTNAFEPLQNEY